jgi:hypothetical protein
MSSFRSIVRGLKTRLAKLDKGCCLQCGQSEEMPVAIVAVTCTEYPPTHDLPEELFPLRCGTCGRSLPQPSLVEWDETSGAWQIA